MQSCFLAELSYQPSASGLWPRAHCCFGGGEECSAACAVACLQCHPFEYLGIEVGERAGIRAARELTFAHAALDARLESVLQHRAALRDFRLHRLVRAARPREHEHAAAWRTGLRVEPRRLEEQALDRLSRRARLLEERTDLFATVPLIALERLEIQALLVAERGVEARRIDAHGACQVGNLS